MNLILQKNKGNKSKVVLLDMISKKKSTVDLNNGVQRVSKIE